MQAKLGSVTRSGRLHAGRDGTRDEGQGAPVTALRFPAEMAVGEVWWEDAREPGGWGHLLAIGEVEVPDRAEVRLSVYAVAEVTVSNQRAGWAALAGTAPRRARPPRRIRETVTWHRDMPDRVLRNTSSIWGGPEEGSYSIGSSGDDVDLRFARGLPPDGVSEFHLGEVVPDSFAAIVHLAPGLKDLSVYIDDLGADAASLIAELTALERLSLAGRSAPEDGPSPRLDDHALSAIADLPALEELSLLGGSYTEQGLEQLRRLRTLRHLHIEREDLTAPMFRFAAAMPALTRLTGLDEFGDDGPMPRPRLSRSAPCSRTSAWTDQPATAGIHPAHLLLGDRLFLARAALARPAGLSCRDWCRAVGITQLGFALGAGRIGAQSRGPSGTTTSSSAWVRSPAAQLFDYLAQASGHGTRWPELADLLYVRQLLIVA